MSATVRGSPGPGISFCGLRRVVPRMSGILDALAAGEGAALVAIGAGRADSGLCSGSLVKIWKLDALAYSFLSGILDVVGLAPLGLVAAPSWLFGSGILLVEEGILMLLSCTFEGTATLCRWLSTCNLHCHCAACDYGYCCC